MRLAGKPDRRAQQEHEGCSALNEKARQASRSASRRASLARSVNDLNFDGLPDADPNMTYRTSHVEHRDAPYAIDLATEWRRGAEGPRPITAMLARPSGSPEIKVGCDMYAASGHRSRNAVAKLLACLCRDASLG
jgi:hypothetical protein